MQLLDIIMESSERCEVFNYPDDVIECVGVHYWNRTKKTNGVCGAASDSISKSSEDEELGDSNESASDLTYLRTLDPKEWKEQDHYAVLGLRTRRHKATELEIKQAYHQRVLHHHPDKRKAKGLPVNENDDYFSCITKAWETLGDQATRRSYDSVDPEFDDTIPLPPASSYNESNFFKIFAPVFKRNERWSEVSPIPSLGNVDTSRDKVEKFYEFWFNFQSWRDYSYNFKEDDPNISGYEKRWNAKQNKNAAAKMKKDEMMRIRSLVNLAYESDPRIEKFKVEDREKKLAAKKAKEEEIRNLKLLAAEKAKEDEMLSNKIKEEEEAKRKEKEASIKAEQDAVKKITKKLKKNVRDLCEKNQYFSDDVNRVTDHITQLEHILELYSNDELGKFYKDLTENGKEAFDKSVEEVKQRLNEERCNVMKNLSFKKDESKSNAGQKKEWSSKELQLLMKAVTLFPAGTNQRWEAITNFITHHNKDKTTQRTVDEVLCQVKQLQTMKNLNKNLVDTMKICNEPNYCEEDNSLEMTNISKLKLWTNSEQQALEKALKTYSAKTPDRWTKIAQEIPTRSKEEVIQRVKELVESVKAKKVANQST